MVDNKHFSDHVVQARSKDIRNYKDVLALLQTEKSLLTVREKLQEIFLDLDELDIYLFDSMGTKKLLVEKPKRSFRGFSVEHIKPQRFTFEYSRPRLKVFANSLFNVEINFSSSEQELTDLILGIKREIASTEFQKMIGELIEEANNSKSLDDPIKKKSFSPDMFFVYDYWEARKKDLTGDEIREEIRRIFHEYHGYKIKGHGGLAKEEEINRLKKEYPNVTIDAKDYLGKTQIGTYYNNACTTVERFNSLL